MKTNKCLAAATLCIGLLQSAYGSPWPTGVPDNVTANMGQRIYIPVLANDLGEDLSLIEVNTTTVALGSVQMDASKRSVYYTSKAGYTGDDSFWYAFKDNLGRTNSTQVFLKVISFDGNNTHTENNTNNNDGGDLEGANAVLVSMHSDFLKKQRFIWGEPGGLRSMKVRQAAYVGSTQLKVAGGFTLMDKQLISYRSTDGQYYTVATGQRQGNTINLRTSLPAPIAQGAEIWNFYSDGSHPNTVGYRSITDFALRNNDLSGLNSGKHVMLGDSWFSSEGIYERLSERLNNAEIVNQGIGGDTSAMLLERFDRHVGNQNPDFVWVMAGTNDYYQGVSVEAYQANMRKIIAKINALGAKAIVFDSSVAPLMSGSNALTETSHRYAEALADLFN